MEMAFDLGKKRIEKMKNKLIFADRIESKSQIYNQFYFFVFDKIERKYKYSQSFVFTYTHTTERRWNKLK